MRILQKDTPFEMKLTAQWLDYPEILQKAIKSGWIPQDRDFAVISPDKWTRAERMMAFIESECRVPEGTLVGQKMILLPFQRMFIRAVYDNPNDTTRRAILSIGRKNGKTSLIAPLTLGHIIGPEANRNSQIVSGAMSARQAGVLMDAMTKIIRLNPQMEQRSHITGKFVRGIAKNVNYMCLAKDGKTAQGLSPNVAILDEVGQVVGPVDKFIEAITTAQGAHNFPLLFAISTQAAADSDLLSIWIDDAERSEDPSTICHVYEATEDCDLLDELEWLKANPAMGVFRSETDLRVQLERAARVPSAEAGARNLLLNQRVSLLQLAVSPAIWRKNGGEVNQELFLREPVHVGLDLSSRNDLTACALSVRDPETGLVHTKPLVFTPLDSLTERSQRDRAPYEQWVKDGFMFGMPGTHMDYDMIAETLAMHTKGMAIATVSYDRWRIDDFKPRADSHGFANEAEWIGVGQGFKDFSLRVEGVESLLLQEKMRHGFHPLYNLGASNAIVVTDPSGNKKYDKSKSSQRIDTLVALAMSVYPLSDGNVEILDVDTMIV